MRVTGRFAPVACFFATAAAGDAIATSASAAGIANAAPLIPRPLISIGNPSFAEPRRSRSFP